jgi:hypothetical protein
MSRGRSEIYAIFCLRFRQGRRIEKPTHILRYTRPLVNGRTTSLIWRSVAERSECVQRASINGVGNSWHGGWLADPMLRRSRDESVATRDELCDDPGRRSAPAGYAATLMGRSRSAPSAGTAGIAHPPGALLRVPPALPVNLLAVLAAGVPEQLVPEVGLHDAARVAVCRYGRPRCGGRSRDKCWRRPPLSLADGDVFLFGSGAVPARPGYSGVVCCCVSDVVWWDLFDG